MSHRGLGMPDAAKRQFACRNTVLPCCLLALVLPHIWSFIPDQLAFGYRGMSQMVMEAIAVRRKLHVFGCIRPHPYSSTRPKVKRAASEAWWLDVTDQDPEMILMYARIAEFLGWHRVCYPRGWKRVFQKDAIAREMVSLERQKEKEKKLQKDAIAREIMLLLERQEKQKKYQKETTACEMLILETQKEKQKKSQGKSIARGFLSLGKQKKRHKKCQKEAIHGQRHGSALQPSSGPNTPSATRKKQTGRKTISDPVDGADQYAEPEFQTSSDGCPRVLQSMGELPDVELLDQVTECMYSLRGFSNLAERLAPSLSDPEQGYFECVTKRIEEVALELWKKFLPPDSKPNLELIGSGGLGVDIEGSDFDYSLTVGDIKLTDTDMTELAQRLDEVLNEKVEKFSNIAIRVHTKPRPLDIVPKNGPFTWDKVLYLPLFSRYRSHYMDRDDLQQRLIEFFTQDYKGAIYATRIAKALFIPLARRQGIKEQPWSSLIVALIFWLGEAKQPKERSSDPAGNGIFAEFLMHLSAYPTQRFSPVSEALEWARQEGRAVEHEKTFMAWKKMAADLLARAKTPT